MIEININQWVLNMVTRVIIDLLLTLIGITYLCVWGIVVVIVLYANFGQRIRMPENTVLIQAANPERYR
jgi:hypothetical protein